MDSNEYEWRDTYFVLFAAERRPTLETLRKAVTALGARYKLGEGAANAEGLFESIMIEAPHDATAIEISYEAGDGVEEQAHELLAVLDEDASREQLAVIRRANARLDVMHFAQVFSEGGGDDEEFDEPLDPAALLAVLDALAAAVHGVTIDPASGTILE